MYEEKKDIREKLFWCHFKLMECHSADDAFETGIEEGIKLRKEKNND